MLFDRASSSWIKGAEQTILFRIIFKILSSPGDFLFSLYLVECANGSEECLPFLGGVKGYSKFPFL